MSGYPGVVVGQTKFTGLFTKAWEKAITSDNIRSGFKACGVFPFNPRAIPDKAYTPNLLYAPHVNPTHSTADDQDLTNPLTSQNYECVSDVVPAPELVDVSGGNLSTNNVVIIGYMANIVNLLPPGMALTALELIFLEDKNKCLASCYSLGYHLSDPSYTQWKQLKDNVNRDPGYAATTNMIFGGTRSPVSRL